MTIRITCTGDVKDTKIVDVESGIELQDNCIKAHIILDAKHGTPEVILHFTDVALDVTGEVLGTFPPAWHRLRAVIEG